MAGAEAAGLAVLVQVSQNAVAYRGRRLAPVSYTHLTLPTTPYV